MMKKLTSYHFSYLYYLLSQLVKINIGYLILTSRKISANRPNLIWMFYVFSENLEILKCYYLFNLGPWFSRD